VISIYINRVPEQLVRDEQGAEEDEPHLYGGDPQLAETCRTPLRRRAPRDRVREQRANRPHRFRNFLVAPEQPI
jgi:hypothetical protein